MSSPIGPDKCPFTGRKFWGNIQHPTLGLVATYGGPFDTYTIPAPGDDNEMRCERFDQDAGNWVEGGEPFGWFSEQQMDGDHARILLGAATKPVPVVDGKCQTSDPGKNLQSLCKNCAPDGKCMRRQALCDTHPGVFGKQAPVGGNNL